MKRGKIERVGRKKLKKLKDSKNFTFNWTEEKEKEVYQIREKGSNEILGLMSLVDYPEEFRVHINLLESRKSQRGKVKKIRNIAGCLIAYACRESFKKGYGGFVSLVPKTRLVPYYKKYGFLEVGIHMAVFSDDSRTIYSKRDKKMSKAKSRQGGLISISSYGLRFICLNWLIRSKPNDQKPGKCEPITNPQITILLRMEYNIKIFWR